ncbi:MAG TPA: HAD family phosphatase [Candidatus Acidoferrales bacterium]|nr:HAD family phosphatase [Candidatus Acidoferrales bacterium]
MPEITTVFWDVGGVILSNGWDRSAREQATRLFGLNGEDFEERHEQANPAFEMGQITLDEYLRRAIFHRSRSFTLAQVKEFIFAQSRPYPDSRSLLDELARSGRYFLATINNEGLELNAYRIQQFGLRRDFGAFFSSCYLGARKPEEAIYRIALQVTQRAPEECVFIDDRPLNLESARLLGMHTVHYQDAAQLREELAHNGLAVLAQ